MKEKEQLIKEVLDQYNKVLNNESKLLLRKIVHPEGNIITAITLIQYGTITLNQASAGKLYEGDIELITEEEKEQIKTELLTICYDSLFKSLIGEGIQRQCELWDAGVFKNIGDKVEYKEYKIKVKG